LVNAVHQADYLAGISVARTIVVTHKLARVKQAAELANNVLQILHVQLKYWVIIVQLVMLKT
jgi:hypothetical protein